MNIIKKYVLQYRNQIFVLLVVIACLLGVYLANIVEDRLGLVANGILSLTVLYLMYLVFLSPQRIIITPSEISKIRFEFLVVIKYLVFGFFWTMIMFWASGHILNLMTHLLSGFAGK
jgi:hypothetical protein